MAPAFTHPLPNVRKKRGVRWKSTEDLVESPRRRLQHVRLLYVTELSLGFQIRGCYQ